MAHTSLKRPFQEAEDDTELHVNKNQSGDASTSCKRVKATAAVNPNTGCALATSVAHDHPTAAVNSSGQQQHINGLSDELLAQTFAYLSPGDRLKASEVCRRWARVTRMPWLDVVHLDLSQLPGENIGATLRACPKLASLRCADQTLFVTDVAQNPPNSLRSLSLLNVDLSVRHRLKKELPELLETALERFLRGLPLLDELALHGVVPVRQVRYVLPVHECKSLTRLQITGSNGLAAAQLFASLCELTNLECLVLGGRLYVESGGKARDILDKFVEAAKAMQNLRELSLVSLTGTNSHDFGVYVLWDHSVYEALRRLTVLMVVFCDQRSHLILNSLQRWIGEHPSLRLLVIAAGSSYVGSETIVPARAPPSPARADVVALPFLNVFVSGNVARKAVFTRSTAAEFRPINRPMPELLERTEAAEIFDGVWTALIIKNLADRKISLWKFGETIAQSVTSIPNQPAA